MTAASEGAATPDTIPAAGLPGGEAAGADPADAQQQDDATHDDGPWEDDDVGGLWELGGDRQLYIGEISDDCHEDWGGTARLGLNNCWWAVGYRGRDALGPLARIPDREAADDLGALLLGGRTATRVRRRRVQAGTRDWVPGTAPGHRIAAAEASASRNAEIASAVSQQLRETLGNLASVAAALRSTAGIARDLTWEIENPTLERRSHGGAA